MNNNDLYGLVLIGGQSTRMKTDKAALVYHGKSQARYAYDLLSEFCPQVYLSKQRDQVSPSDCRSLPEINDRDHYKGVGPLGGILSAMEMHPGNSWLVLACDLPFVAQATIHDLLQNRDRKRCATAYNSAHDGLPEPLCAVYEHHALERMRTHFQDGIVCPRKILVKLSCHLIDQADKRSLDNINSPEDYRAAVRKTSAGRIE